jgi:hypothetical protein
MIRLYVEGVGLRGPGLDGWPAGRGVLAGNAPYAPSPIVVPECDFLPSAERRRAVPSVKLALAVDNEAVLSADGNRANLATVFTSSAGDNRTLHEIMQVLATPSREVSPTRFHNSVHNAAAGYWHIASLCREASTSIACHDASFAAGLLEAASQIATGSGPVLLVAYDLPYPAPLDAVRPISGSFATAFVLTPAATARSMAEIDIAVTQDAEKLPVMDDPALEALRAGNPAARSLPLLQLLARDGSGAVRIGYVAGNMVAVSVQSLETVA